MAALSSSKRSMGRHRSVAMHPAVGPHQPLGELLVEVGGTREAPAGQKARLEVAVVTLDDALGLGVGRPQHHDLHAEGPSEALERLAQGGLAATTRHEGALVVIDALLGHGPERLQAGQVPRQDVVGLTARGSSWPPSPASSRVSPTITGGFATSPFSRGMSAGGNHRSHWASSPGRYWVRPPDQAADRADGALAPGPSTR